jgi:hypothetical protein
MSGISPGYRIGEDANLEAWPKQPPVGSLALEYLAADPGAAPGLTLDAGELRFFAARLRRLFQHFGTPVPGMEDDARLIGNAGAGIGLLLTGRTDGALVVDGQTVSDGAPHV